MINEKNFMLTIGATIALLGLGMFLPSQISMILSVLFFAVIPWLNPKLLIPALLVYYPFRPFLVEMNEGLKLAGDIGIIALFLYVVFQAFRQKDVKSIFQLQWYEWAYLLFCAVGAIAALFTGVTLVAIVFQLRKFLIMYLLFYGIKRLKWDREEIVRILKLIVGVAIVLIAHGFIEKLSQRQWLLPQAWMEQFISPANFERIYGLLGNPNSMGLYMFIAIIAGLVLLRLTGNKLWYIPTVLAFGTLLLTYSRGSWIGIILGGVIYLILARKKGLIKQVAISAVAGYFLVFLPITYTDQLIVTWFGDNPNLNEDGSLGEAPNLGDRIGDTFDKESIERSLNTGRIFFVKVGFEILMDYPIIGTGFGTFGDSAALVYSSPIYDDYGLKGIYDYMGKDFYSDNQYIQIIVQTGILGTLLFALFLLNILYRLWTMRKDHPDEANVGLLIWLFVSIVGVVYNVWENQTFAMLFFAFIAWLETVRKGNSEPLSLNK